LIGYVPDWASVVEKCSGEQDGREVKSASIDHLPSWAVSAQATETDPQSRFYGIPLYIIVGNYRGVTVGVEAYRRADPTADDFLAAAAKLFNDQIAKLEAAP